MTTTLKYRFQFRYGTAAQWTASNEVLLADEGGHESDTNKLKIGDGVTAWNSLPYFSVAPYVIATGTADAITATYGHVVVAGSLIDGLLLRVRALLANATTTPTFNPSGLGALTITKQGGVALAVGDIARVGHELLLVYSTQGSAHYELINPAVSSSGGVVAVVAGTNVTVDNTDPTHPIVSASNGSGGGGHTPGPGTDTYIANVISLIPLDARSNTTGFYDFCENVLSDMGAVYGDKANQQYGHNTMRNTTAGLTVFSNGQTPPFASSGVLINAQDFCWEIDVKTAGTLAAFSTIVGNRPTNSGTAGTVCVGINGSGQLYVYGGSAFIVSPTSATQVTSPGTAFNKLAYDVYGGVGSLYLNGAKIGSGAQATLNYTAKCSIGADYNGTEALPGNFANFRFTLGVSRYKGVAYTPLTTPYPFS